MNRRTLLAGSASLTVGMAVASRAAGAVPGAVPASLAIQGDGGTYKAALAKLVAYAQSELEGYGLPGMTLALSDDAGFSASLSLGTASVENGELVRPDHLFEIGSISKSITALCVHRLAARGLLDLKAPVSRYLDAASLPETPITLGQLLNHAGGLPHDAALYPDTPDGRLWCGFAPGTRFSYSNTGYMLLGLVIGAVTGRPHPEVIAREVLHPLGMHDAHAHLSLAARAEFATGYVPEREDLAAMTRIPMVRGPFLEDDFASGTVGASARDMAGYLRFVIGLGQGKGAPLLSDADAAAFLAQAMPNTQFGPGSLYASGIATVTLDDRPVLHHTGGMLAFSSSFHVDAPAGVGAFASVNARLGGYRPRQVTAYAVRLLRAAREGLPLPEAPDPLAARRIAEADRFAGTWQGSDGRTFELVREAGDGLKLVADGQEGRVEGAGKDVLATDHRDYASWPLQFDAKSNGLWWGDTLFAKGARPEVPPQSEALLPYTGLFGDGTPWFRTRLVVRGDTLWSDLFGAIVPREGGHWSARADEGATDRLWMDKMLGGRLHVLNFSGAPYRRIV
ncbi:serine hydrolase domain-containing protein [Novosphingobium mangrovi (ex Hu et al. 2023)]|uniref:Beta-lactamase n=1 Tax=Novosphingobium mangrovi (ex Hu et al. 2023) TaxID=2930094 RepID=A0ABT0ACP6_9SPHN|nr:serine hydrolase domain-containing protein [Novosphingobium mangrovi (ex Hu et al. 2023)]MCJ1960978.1 beta-lactamase family protein [Novosphingobium mangrovi (ex Hu et al. 2023)]